MTNKKRYFTPGSTYYISLQGQDGMECFFDEACYHRFLLRLTNCLNAYQVKLHSYVLLPNSIQLLMTPTTPTGISGLMQTSINAYAQYYNDRFERESVLWPGEFNSCRLASSGLVLECQKYIELAPVRAGLASCPGRYHWSSYCINAFGGHGYKLTMHEQYKKFGSQAVNRFKFYREYVASSFSRRQLRLMQSRLITSL